MSNKFMPQGILGHGFAVADASTFTEGDLVGISGNFTVVAATAAIRPIGRVVTIDKHTNRVVVELFAAMIFEVTVGATAVVAGNYVKVSATNTVIPAATGTTATDVPLAFAIALNGGATGAKVTIVPIG